MMTYVMKSCKQIEGQCSNTYIQIYNLYLNQLQCFSNENVVESCLS